MTVSPNMIAMNKYDTQLRDLIHVEKGIIPANLCEYLVDCLLYTSPSPRDAHESRMPSSA